MHYSNDACHHLSSALKHFATCLILPALLLWVRLVPWQHNQVGTDMIPLERWQGTFSMDNWHWWAFWIRLNWLKNYLVLQHLLWVYLHIFGYHFRVDTRLLWTLLIGSFTVPYNFVQIQRGKNLHFQGSLCLTTLLHISSLKLHSLLFCPHITWSGSSACGPGVCCPGPGLLGRWIPLTISSMRSRSLALSMAVLIVWVLTTYGSQTPNSFISTILPVGVSASEKHELKISQKPDGPIPEVIMQVHQQSRRPAFTRSFDSRV